MTSIHLTGVNYKNTPIEIRERLALDEAGCRELLSALRHDERIQESVVLSTCNRTELYVVEDGSKPELNGYLPRILLNFTGLTDKYADQYFYHASDLDAVEHLFEVAAGLDSMVLGENQILGQIRQAYTIAVEQNTTGKFLNKVFHQSFRVGKRSRSETKINAGAASVGSVAVELAKKIFLNISDKNVLMVGAGEMAQTTLMSLKNNGVNHLLITNRTLQKAEQLARQFNAEVIPFEQLREALTQVDVVISSTSARQIIMSYEFIRNIMGMRKNRPLFIIDIAVPRDVEKSAKEIYNVFLYDIDDLKDIVDANLKKRQSQIPKVKAIIAEELKSFSDWYRDLDILPTIKQLQKHFEEIRQREVQRNRKYFVQEDWEQVDKFSRSLLKKFLHSPMVRLHECKKDVSDLCGRCTVRQVFGLDENE